MPFISDLLNCWDFPPLRRKETSNNRKLDKQFYPSACLPHFVRRAIKTGILEQLPTRMTFDAVLLTIEIPVSRGITDLHLKSYDIENNAVHEIKSFFNSLFDVLHQRGGDIFSFLDSTIRCFWVVTEDEYVDATYFVLELAIQIKDIFCGKYSTETWKIESRSVITTGTIEVIFVGDLADRVMWCVTGEPVDELLCNATLSNEIIITDLAWKNLSFHQALYTAIPLEDNYLNVLKIPNIRSHRFSKKSLNTKFNLKVSSLNDSLKNICFTPGKTMLDEMEELFNWYETFRLHVVKCCTPLSTSVVNFEQLEILSSMTSIVFCLIYIEIDKICLPESLNGIMKKVKEITTHYDGLLNLLEDRKGIVFGIIFGNIGFKHNDDCPRSLRWASDIIPAMEKLGHKAIVRIFSGMCYAGVLGPIGRMTYCIIGHSASKALMSIYHFKDTSIICDSAVALRSQRELGSDIFTLVGKHSGRSSECTNFFAVDFSASPAIPAITCIGREMEKNSIIKAILRLKDQATNTNDLPIIVINGDVGCGKTTFLKYIVQEAPKCGIELACFIGDVFFEEEEYHREWYVLKTLLIINNINDERGILKLLRDDDISKYPLHLLNQYLHTQFPRPAEDYSHLDIEKQLLITLIKACAKGRPILIAIDDGDRVLPYACNIFQELIQSRIIIALIVFEKASDLQSSEFLNGLSGSSNVTITLAPLQRNAVLSLICHFLRVTAVHKDLFSFLCVHSSGNPLKMQEILLLPQIQRHISIVKDSSISPKTLADSFCILENYNVQKFVGNDCTRVCDLFDPTGLQSVTISERLLDVVEKHTSGLTTEEQLLIKKCACLGQKFGLYILKAVCPEYTLETMLSGIWKVVKKNLLTLNCKHFVMDENGIRLHLQLELAEEYCQHAIRFTSQFSRQCVVNLIQKGQKERLHLIFVSLLKDADVPCDSCRSSVGKQVLPKNKFFYNHMYIPRICIVHCHCVNFLLSIHKKIYNHMIEGNAQLEKRIMFLLKSAEIAVYSGKQLGVIFENIQKDIKELEESKNKKSLPKLHKVQLLRINAQRYYFSKEINECKSYIYRAFKELGKTFPEGYLKRKFEVHPYTSLKKEEMLCLFLGCKILQYESDFENAYIIAKQFSALRLLHIDESSINRMSVDIKIPSLRDVLTRDATLLQLGSKAKKRKSKSRVAQHMREILEDCCLQLREEHHNNVRNLQYIISALIVTTFVLFERNDLTSAEAIGFRAFQICNITHGVKEMNEIAPILCLIYYYLHATEKCFEMLSVFAGSTAQSDAVKPKAMYYSIIVKLLSHMENPTIRRDKIKMCTDFVVSSYHRQLPFCSYEKQLWITSLLSMWCLQQNITDAYTSWYQQAIRNRENAAMVNYWSLEGEIRMLRIELLKVKQNAIAMSTDKACEEINNISKNVEKVSEYVQKYAVVLIPELEKTRVLIRQLLAENT